MSIDNNKLYMLGILRMIKEIALDLSRVKGHDNVINGRYADLLNQIKEMEKSIQSNINT